METKPTPSDLISLHISIQGHLDQVHVAAQTICQALALILDAEGISKVEIGTAEAINNIITHGKPESSIIDIYCFQTLAAIIIIIEDESEVKVGSLYNQCPSEKSFSAIEEVPESGWGVFLIKKCFTHSFYTTEKHKNRLILCYETP